MKELSMKEVKVVSGGRLEGFGDIIWEPQKEYDPWDMYPPIWGIAPPWDMYPPITILPPYM